MIFYLLNCYINVCIFYIVRYVLLCTARRNPLSFALYKCIYYYYKDNIVRVGYHTRRCNIFLASSIFSCIKRNKPVNIIIEGNIFYNIVRVLRRDNIQCIDLLLRQIA